MATWSKHRRSEIDRSADFTNVLNSTETISSVNSIEITRYGRTVDLSTEFGSPTGTPSTGGKLVDFTLGASTDSAHQERGTYQVLVEARSSEGEDVVADDRGSIPTLYVSDEGDTSA